MELSERFYLDAVRPLLVHSLGDLPHAAALLGNGSEVLGYDDAMSTDHHWGPRVMLFVRPEHYARTAETLIPLLAERLPRRFGGYPTNFSPPDPNDHGVQRLEDAGEGPINHRVEVLTAAGFVRQQLNFDLAQTLEPVDWLTFPEQRLLSITAGAVFCDEIGLEQVRAQFSYYPHDVWLYLLAAAWARIGQEEHLMGRAGYAGDELGAGLIAGRLVRDVMRLCFLLERTYAPYAKWFGTAFRRLPCGADLVPILQGVLAGTTWQARERWLCEAYAYVARLHRQLDITPALPQEPRQFFGRPFRVMALHGYADSLRARIADPQVRALAETRLIGSIDLFSDNVDLLEDNELRPMLRTLYETKIQNYRAEQGHA
jgi:hypothetical protein